MARTRITLEDEAGREIAGTEPRFYELRGRLDNLHQIGLDPYHPSNPSSISLHAIDDGFYGCDRCTLI